MRIGTKSVLFGVHCFFIHPFFVALGWWRLYGFPWDPRLWVAFFVHDLGYLGKPNMDGPEGEWHPAFGASILGALFDARVPLPRFDRRRLIARAFNAVFGDRHSNAIGQSERRFSVSWYCFAFYHSRYLARCYNAPVSHLCYADKLATALEPWWLYLPRANASGEIREYMAAERLQRWTNEPLADDERTRARSGSQRAWYRALQSYLRRWVDEHKDGREDAWTGKQR